MTSREILAKDRLEILWLFTPLIKSTKLVIENERNTESPIYEVIWQLNVARNLKISVRWIDLDFDRLCSNALSKDYTILSSILSNRKKQRNCFASQFGITRWNEQTSWLHFLEMLSLRIPKNPSTVKLLYIVLFTPASIKCKSSKLDKHNHQSEGETVSPAVKLCHRRRLLRCKRGKIQPKSDPTARSMP